jgi:prepilin-type N-terminal cleavage/methylation domain-containing protein/uncharacterized repeat protein (TIGR02543 family)
MNKYSIFSFLSGFTLIELLVVISIIGFLSSVVLASLQTARIKANDVKIAQDLNQVKTAVELYYADHQSYNIAALGETDKTILVVNQNNNASSFEWINIFSTKKAEALTSQQLCDNFSLITQILVNHKYLSAIPVYPNQNTATGLCYKSATSSDGTYFAAYAPLSTSVSVGGSNVLKNTGFVVGDTSIDNLNKIRLEGTNNEYPHTVGDTPIISMADIADEVIDITSGSVGVHRSSGDSSLRLSYTLNVTTTGSGSVTKSSSESTYSYGDTVTLTTSSGAGYIFTGWGGACSGIDTSCVVTIDGSKSVSATFSLDTVETQTALYRTYLKQVVSAVETYKNTTGSYPTTMNSISSLTGSGGILNSYIKYQAPGNLLGYTPNSLNYYSRTTHVTFSCGAPYSVNTDFSSEPYFISFYSSKTNLDFKRLYFKGGSYSTQYCVSLLNS